MLKKWFTLPAEEDFVAPQGVSRQIGVDPAKVVGIPVDEPVKAIGNSSETGAIAAAGSPAAAKYSSFEQVYQNAATKPPRLAYNIMKVAEMVNSGHLITMSPEAKRNSLLMALEAATVAVEDVLQDAVIRQKALSDYEDVQKSRLKNFEQSKSDENTKIQAELERLTNLHMARIQANLDDVAKEQDNFRVWQKSKNQESQRITEAAAFCVPEGSPVTANRLAGVLERATLTK
jgi:hypothetical protein